MDAEAWLFVIPALTIGLWALFNVGRPSAPATPAVEPQVPALPVMVNLGSLMMRTRIVLTGVESDFRSRGLVHEAEGARQMRVAVLQLLESMKIEGTADER